MPSASGTLDRSPRNKTLFVLPPLFVVLIGPAIIQVVNSKVL